MIAMHTHLTHGLPVPAGLVIGRVSSRFGQFLLPVIINRALARQIEDGQVDFLRHRVLEVCVTDLAVAWRFTLATSTSSRITHSRNEPDTTIRGDSIALLLLATRRVDPDTLFFHRRLIVEGDTELSLQAKNLLDTLEEDDLPVPLAHLLAGIGRLVEHWPEARQRSGNRQRASE